MPKEFFEVPVDPTVKETVLRAIEEMRALGATVHEVTWPLYHYYESISTILLLVEGAAAYRELVCTKGSGLYEPLRMRLQRARPGQPLWFTHDQEVRRSRSA